jgi:hypothetical protein
VGLDALLDSREERLRARAGLRNDRQQRILAVKSARGTALVGDAVLRTRSRSPGDRDVDRAVNADPGIRPTAGPVGGRRSRAPDARRTTGGTWPALTQVSSPVAGSRIPKKIVANMFERPCVRAM